MKKIITPILLLFFIVSCQDECQDLLDQVNETRGTFINSPTNGNCLAYQNALNNYLSSSCDNPSNVNYDQIFQDYLSSLVCDTFPVVGNTCSNGVQDLGETGIDCGGICAPCNSNYFISFNSNGTPVYFDANPLTYLGGSSDLDNSGFSQSFGNAENAAYLTFNFAGVEPVLSSFQNSLNVVYSFENLNPNGYADFDFNLGGNYETYDAGNTTSNSSFKFTSVSFYNQNILFGDTIDNFTVEGQFNCQAYNGSDTTQITNGVFKLLFAHFR